MEITKREFKTRSSDGAHTLSGVVYLPSGEIKGYFQVVHGMTEHIGRYDAFMREMARGGFVCFGHDNLGHGNSVNDPSEHGYIAKKGGWELLAKDVKVFSDAVRAEYGNDGAPYVLMGHSMGSFIVRLAAARVLRPDRLVIMGTGGPNPAAGAGIAIVELLKLFGKEKKFSPFVDKMAFGKYNERFEGELSTAPSPWLTTDVDIRKKYAADPFCAFKFTVSAMGDLIRLNKYANDKRWYADIPKDMPILLISGADDPVGDYSSGVLAVRDRLKAAGADVECVLYDGARHEILNDFTRERATADILNFASKEK